MIAISRILVPTDFSRFSEPAVETARLLTERFDAELHLLHVIQDILDRIPDFGMGLDLQPLQESRLERQEQHELAALEKLTGLLDPEWKKEHRTVIATRTGTPFVEIIRYAKEHQTDLIVMGTHGRTGLRHAMLGSVAENVLRNAPCAVLTVRPEDDGLEAS